MSAGTTRETSHLLAALSDRYRRVVCYYIRDHEQSSLATMAGPVTDWVEAGPGPDESAEYDDVLALLHHVYLPRLDEADLVSYDATTREVEDRAWRTGGGTLYAGFQSLSAFETQVPVYERLVADTDLRAVVFGRPDWEPPALEGVTLHRDADGDLADFWVVAFDGAGDNDETCALLAEETGQYSGVVTCDAAVVDDIVARLDGVAGYSRI